MIVTHEDINSQPYKVISPVAVEYNSNQYRPDEALDDLKDKVNSIGGDAIIGFSWSPVPIFDKNAQCNMIAQGTAVILKTHKNKKKNYNQN